MTGNSTRGIACLVMMYMYTYAYVCVWYTHSRHIIVCRISYICRAIILHVCVYSTYMQCMVIIQHMYILYSVFHTIMITVVLFNIVMYGNIRNGLHASMSDSSTRQIISACPVRLHVMLRPWRVRSSRHLGPRIEDPPWSRRHSYNVSCIVKCIL